MADMFGKRAKELAAKQAPLAERMRPHKPEDYLGQQQLVGVDGALRAVLDGAEGARVRNMILWGPPGTGKTTLARLIAERSGMEFEPLSATSSGVKDIRDLLDRARLRLGADGKATLVFIDEIHRFNKAQQDSLLHAAEDGLITLIGATTENPSFEVNAALLSRCRVVVLEPLRPLDLEALVLRALEDGERGLGRPRESLEAEALASLVQLASGDARRALTLLEAAMDDARSAGRETVGAADLERVAQRKILVYDKAGEEHFNLISALHKSLRESDPDAGLYWLARMLEAGEDGNYVARRLVRFAVEDVGLADPRAVEQALAGWQAYERLGSPEGDLALAQVALYLAMAPKSVSVYRAWGKVRETIARRPADPVPRVIRNAPTRLMKETGYGAGYEYAPDVEGGVAGLECLPEALAGTSFWQPGSAGFEARLSERLAAFAERRAAARRRRD